MYTKLHHRWRGRGENEPVRIKKHTHTQYLGSLTMLDGMSNFTNKKEKNDGLRRYLHRETKQQKSTGKASRS